MADEPQAQQPIVININLGDLFEGLLRRKKAKADPEKKSDWVQIDGPQPYAG